MLVPERQSRLKDLLGKRGMADVDSLAAELGVSQSTIRRDIEMLEQAGFVERTHGGVIWTGGEKGTGANGRRPYAFNQRMSYEVERKKQIAAAAKQLIQPGQTLLIDGGTTTLYFAQELLGTPLQLVTNSLPIANLFLDDDNVELVVTGGLMYPRYGVLLGPMTQEMLGTIHAKTLVLSVAGIHDGALYNQNLLLVQSERKMMEQAQEVVLLVDSSKFGQQALSRLCRLDEIDMIVSDAGITPEQREQVAAAGCRLIVANELAAESGGAVEPQAD